jgi:glycerophosphoryl diester phosphodiesterase
MRDSLLNAAMRLVDTAMAVLPRRLPEAAVLRDCRIIAHRGEHDNRGRVENTLPAFQAARDAGAWGIECDVRWTADGVPVIHHDEHAARLFGDPSLIRDLRFDDLRRRLPMVPSLAEVIETFGGHTHLMLELKAGHRGAGPGRQQTLRRHLEGLEPVRDFHLLGLQPGLFEGYSFVPREACYLVAETNVRRRLRECIEQDWGGLTGHYLLMGEAVLQALRAAGRGVGTGFIGSRGCLLRELNRGVRWLFSNDAAALVQAQRSALAALAGGGGKHHQ